MRVKLRERYLGSEVIEDRIIKPKKDDRGERAEVVAVSISVANGAGSVIVSEKGIIVVSINGVEHDIRFVF